MVEKHIKTSKYLSWVLRHAPRKVGLEVSNEGWVSISRLIKLSQQRGIFLNRKILYDIVETDSKKRYQLSDDLKSIRATYGHSFHVDLGSQAKQPPPILYHGTADKYLDSIRERGINPGRRQFVHLSTERDTAVGVGRRHGKPVVLKVNSAGMYENGFRFYSSQGVIWLTEYVPGDFILNFR